MYFLYVFKEENGMNEINAKELKRIESLLKEVSTLELEKQQLADRKGSLAADEYKQLLSQNRERTKEIKTELSAFKRNCSKNLETVQTQLMALKREEKGLHTELKEVESNLKSDSADRKELTVEKKTILDRLKALEKERTQQKKQEALILKGAELFTRQNAVPEKKEKPAPANEETPQVEKEGINPLYAAGALISVIIIVAIIVQTTFFRKDLPEAVVEENTVEQVPDPVENTTEIMDAEGVITGNNVNLRQQPNIMSSVIKQLQMNDAVTIYEKRVVNESKDAVLSRMTQLTTEDGEKIKLDAGKGIVVLEEKEDVIIVSYPIDDGKSITGSVEKDAVKQISGDVWYRVRNAASIEGWIYGKYVELK